MLVTKVACLLMPFVYTVTSTAVNAVVSKAVNTTKFDLKSSKRIISTEFIERDVIVASVIECAIQCSSYDFCETASFDHETMLCNLCTSCNPDTLDSQFTTFIRKRTTRNTDEVLQSLRRATAGCLATCIGVILNNEEFKPIFVAFSGNQQSVLDTWRTPSKGGEIENNDNSFSLRHLRSSIIDTWNGSIIDQVKVELFSNGKLGLEIYFDGYLSTSSNWFSMERLFCSSFNDLTKMSTLNFFSMNGEQTVDRHFYISSNHGGCSKDTLWMVVIDTADANYRPCFYDHLHEKEYPYILFGPYQHKVKMNDGTYAVAEKMVISISKFI